LEERERRANASRDEDRRGLNREFLQRPIFDPPSEAGKPRRRASVRVSLTATQAREIADGLYKMADATVMGQTPVAPPSQVKN